MILCRFGAVCARARNLLNIAPNHDEICTALVERRIVYAECQCGSDELPV